MYRRLLCKTEKLIVDPVNIITVTEMLMVVNFNIQLVLSASTLQ